jgi:hypothetical protein
MAHVNLRRFPIVPRHNLQTLFRWLLHFGEAMGDEGSSDDDDARDVNVQEIERIFNKMFI